ncbi:MAG: DUF2971 domain-containing protein [Streptococcus sp.]|nr:DUF2971 domain-containing protein [Streptococcus sp.]
MINLVFGQAVNGLNSYSLSIYNDFNELEKEETQKDFILLLKLVYNIKQILLIDTVKDDIEAFGHYTSLQALGFMLAMNEIEQDGQRQKLKNSETYSRLSHVLHMNDPKEGKMLDEYLGISDHNFKKSDADLTSSVTPWFLMSLTTNLDNLAMWSQYGDNAKGVCIAFKKESFKLQKPANFSDMSFKSYKSTLQKDENDADCSKFEIKEFDDENDYLYKVAYITTKGSQSAIKILETDLIKEKDAGNISNSLKDIKNIFSKNKENNDVIKIFSKHLDEVRYLFKSADYAYESELRLLKYVDFSDREKIKLNATKDSLPKLYVQRKSPIALNKIIFGPKLVEVEDLLPYIYLYDKNIECTRSSIDFR